MKDITAIQYVKPRNINPEVMVYVYDEYDDVTNKLVRTGVRRSIQLDDIEDAIILAKIQEIKEFISEKEGI